MAATTSSTDAPRSVKLSSDPRFPCRLTTGFSAHWYGKALSNVFLDGGAAYEPDTWPSSRQHSAAIFGTLAAIGLQQLGPRLRAVFDALGAAVVMPGVIIGVSTLVALVALFGVLNPALAPLSPWPQPPQFGLGYGLRIIEASRDLDATTASSPSGRWFCRSWRHRSSPAFTFSFDDFIIAFFVAGAHNTLPNLRFFLDPPRRHPGNQRNRHAWSLPRR